MNNSRTKNVLKNMFTGTFFKVLSLIMGFINRTIFIKILSTEYLGINSLFTNILTILSFAELGIGNAIVFNLYKPIASNDKNKINILLKFYKQTYRLIGLIVLILGLSFVPFLPSLISEMPKINENIYLIYIVFLLDAVVSYFFTYRISIITADQKDYIVIRTVQIFKIFQIIIQICLLYLTHNYYLYLILQLLNTIITFVYLSHISKKMYPFTKKLGEEDLSKTERKGIFKNVKALIISKFGNIILDGTDSIIISKYIGLATLGLYSNYLLLISAIIQILAQVLNSFTASIGNLNTENTNIKKEKVFNLLYYFTMFLFGLIGITLYIMLNDFITLWLGNEYLLSKLTVFSIILHFYINGVQFSSFTYRQTAGLFREYKYLPVLAAILNVFLSIFLAKYIGLPGVFFATSISRLLTAGWADPIIVYKKVFNKKATKYFIKYIYYIVALLFSFIVTNLVVSYINVNSILLFIFKGFLTVLISTLCIIFFTFKTKEFNEIYSLIKKSIKIFK